jgi:demethylmenaquinone methyltransferase/2-methoxy-6-polyprenyl-1,4-benzoquinol methylase/phosphoethanolamine N-methyltransferase
MSAATKPPATKGRLIRWPIWYDRLNRLAFLGRESRFRELTVDLAAIASGYAVLDVGCGTGNLTIAAVLRAGTDGEVHGIDPAPEMIQEAQRKAAEKQLDVRFQVGLIEKLPFADGKFDVVLSSLMLHHLPRDLKRRGVAEIFRVLKPGGRFVAVDFDPPSRGNLRIVEDAMTASGFTEIRRGKTAFRAMFIPIYHLSGTRIAMPEDTGSRV